MAKQYKTGIIITGDASGAIKQVKLTDAQLEKLNVTQGKTQTKAKGLAGDMASLAKGAALWGAAAAGAAAVGVAALVKSCINAADAAIKAAQGAGVTVESLTAMQYAADLAGVSNDKLGTAMGRLNRSVSDAAKGLKTQSQAFADLGISVNDAEGNLRSADQVLLDVADKFSQYEDGAAKAAIAQELFGRAGADLIPMLNQGADGIRGLMEEAQQLGLVIDTETAQASEKFNDSLNTMGKIGDGVGNTLMKQLLPTMNDITGLMLDYAKNSDAASTAARGLDTVLKGLVTVAVGVGAVFNHIQQGLGSLAAAAVQAVNGDLRGAWKTLQAGSDDILGGYEAALERIIKLWNGDYAKAGNDLNHLLIEVTNRKSKLTRQTKELEDQLKQEAKALAEQEKALAAVNKELDKMFEAEDKQAVERAKIIESSEYQLSVLERELQAVQSGEAAHAALNRELYRENVLRSEAYQAILPSQRDAYIKNQLAQYDLQVAIADVTDEMEAQAKQADSVAASIARGYERMRDAVGDFFQTLIVDGKASFSDLLDLFKSMIAEMIATAAANRIFIGLGVGGASGNALASGLGGGGSGSGSGGGLGDLMSLSTLAKGLDSLGAGVTSLADVMGANLYTSNAGYYGGQIGGALGLEGMSANAQVGLGTVANALAGYAGAWVGTNVGEAIFGKEAESAWGATIGTAIGSIWGPWFAALGGAIGGLIDAATGGDGKKRLALGVSTDPDRQPGDHIATQIQAASGLSLTSYDKRVGDEGRDAAIAMAEQFAMIDAVLFSFTKNLGITADLLGDTLEGKASEYGTDLNKTFFGAAGYNELDPAQLVGAADEFVRAWVSKVNEKFDAGIDLAAIENLRGEGELLADVFYRLQANIVPVNSTLDALGLQMYDMSIAGMAGAASLAALFGGLEQFGESTAQYYQLYYSEEERLARTAGQLGEVFGSLNIAVPESVAAFRDFVDGLDLTTDEGKIVFAGLMKIAPAFHQVAVAQEAAAAAADLLDGAIVDVGDTLSDVAKKLIDERASLEVELMRAQGNSAGADAAQYLIDTAGMSDAERVLFDYNAGLRDQITALEQAAQAQAQAAATAAQVANERDGIEARILQAQGDTVAIRERELALLDPSNQARQQELWALEDAAAAANEAAIAEQALASERERIASRAYSLETQLLQLQSESEKLRERELALLDPSNQARQQEIWALQDATAAADQAAAAEQALASERERIASQAYSLETQLLQLQGETVQLRERELALLDPSNQARQQEIWALQDATAAAEQAAAAEQTLADKRSSVAAEHYSLETRLLQLQGDAEKLRERELALLDPSNRAIQQEIWAIEDRNDALAAAEKASQSFTDSLGKLVDYARDLRGLADGLRLSDLSPLTDQQRLQFSQSQLAAVQVRIESGDDSAYGEVESAIDNYLKEARSYYASSQTYSDIFNELTNYADTLAARLMDDATGQGYIPGYADGGITNMPASGGMAMLHGREGIVPLKNGYIPVQVTGGGDDSRVVEKLDEISRRLFTVEQTIQEGNNQRTTTNRHLDTLKNKAGNPPVRYPGMVTS